MVYQVQQLLAVAPSLFSSSTFRIAVFTAAAWAFFLFLTQPRSSPFTGLLCSGLPALRLSRLLHSLLLMGSDTKCTSCLPTRVYLHYVTMWIPVSAVTTIYNCLVGLLASWWCFCPLEYKLAKERPRVLFFACVPSTYYNAKHVIST